MESKKCCLFVLLLGWTMVIVSAQRPSCATIRCGFGTTCVDGRCVCGENRHFEQCGSACPARCDLGSAAVACTADCKPGCFCNEGFVLARAGGECVRRERCPIELRCGRNEEAKACGACDQSCNQGRRACTLDCREPECGCRDGFFRNSQGQCVPESSQCRSFDQCSRMRCRPGTVCRNGQCVSLDDQCGENEQFAKCGTACEPTCEKPQVSFCTLNCIPNVCQCRRGFVRHFDGSCVTQNRCSRRPGDTRAGNP
uniref:TIL domain-containing protein n=1 Tax=Plectus sambesii TaxID=2011161 RepID=A0A914ULG9_9BILA